MILYAVAFFAKEPQKYAPAYTTHYVDVKAPQHEDQTLPTFVPAKGNDTEFELVSLVKAATPKQYLFSQALRVVGQD